MDHNIDPALYDRDDLLPVLAGHDIGALYRALNEAGINQRQIAQRTGQSQSEISEICNGTRRVHDYRVLERIAEGLGIPRELMGLGYGAYAEQVTVAEPVEEAEEVLRRHLLAKGGIAIAGATVPKLGELLTQLPEPPLIPPPARLSGFHVTQVRDLTRRLDVGDTYSDPQVCSSAAALATRLLDVPGPEPVTRALMIAVGELHSVAGWATFDAGLCQRALYHHAESLDLATRAGDRYLQALALTYAGGVTVERGYPDDGLKLLQCGQVTAWGIPADDHRAVVVGEVGKAAVEATALETSATALARLGDLNSAATALAKGRDLWTPVPSDPFGDTARPAALLELERGRLDTAEALAAASARRWEGGRLTSRTRTAIVLAAVHVRAGEPKGLTMSKAVLGAVARLDSPRIRRQLAPLVEALDTRPGTDARDLARQARQVAATRA